MQEDTHPDLALSASEWESLVVSKGNSIRGCSRFLKHRNQQVQIHVEETFWRRITAPLKEVKSLVICQGDHSSNEWMGTVSRAKNCLASQTCWPEYRASLNSPSSCTPEHSPNQVFLCPPIWPSLALISLFLNNPTVQNLTPRTHSLLTFLLPTCQHYCSALECSSFPSLPCKSSLTFQFLLLLGTITAGWLSQALQTRWDLLFYTPRRASWTSRLTARLRISRPPSAGESPFKKSVYSREWQFSRGRAILNLKQERLKWCWTVRFGFLPLAKVGSWKRSKVQWWKKK